MESREALSVNPFDEYLPDELLQHVLLFTNHEGAAVSKRFAAADKEITNQKADLFFHDYLAARAINFEKINPRRDLSYITTFALHSLPRLSDSTMKTARVGVLLLQLFEIMHYYTSHQRLSFTMEREEDALEHTIYNAAFNHETKSRYRTAISEDDLENIKDDANDILSFAAGTDAPIRTRYFAQMVNFLIQDFKSGLKEASQHIGGSHHHLLMFGASETSMQKFLRLTNMCVCLLESFLLPPQPKLVTCVLV